MAAVALACAQCSVQFLHPGARGRRPKLCPACAAKAKTGWQAAYRAAHSVGHAPSYAATCSFEGCTSPSAVKGLCRHHYYRRRAAASGVLSRATRNAQAACYQIHRCKHCGVDFQPKRAGRTTFCSQRCSFAAKTAAKKPKAPAVIKALHACGCGQMITSRATRCVSCAKEVSRAEYLAARPVRHCEDCGAHVEAGKYQRRCATCWAVHRKQVVKDSRRTSPSRRASKAKRKAMDRGKLAGAERFDPIEILNRDKWHCHICGISTPRSLRGTYADRAPELDHILPLAAGGQHTRANTACACRRCNLAKGASPKGQLRLFG